jgi:two-component system, OmpR family, KDP operon response regulator KdpE
VDDDPQIRRTMRATLIARGYEIADARTGEKSLDRIRSETYDLVLLDMNMPGIGGKETCRILRQASDIAIIMLTVSNSEKERVDALEAGADDYVTKPFSMPELLARIRAALRRLPLNPAMAVQKLRLDDDVEIDFAARQVTDRGRTVRLTPKEFELLSYLTAHPNRTVSHRELLQAVWGPDYGEEIEYLRVFINRLHKKVEPEPANPRFLITDAWAGYRFHFEEQSNCEHLIKELADSAQNDPCLC